MANPNLVDMTEEDAADLQFPKDCASRLNSNPDHELEVSVVKDKIFTSDSGCRTCKSSLIEPYINCVVCEDAELCPPCFAKGSEIDEHRNDHDYVVVRNEFPLISNSGWSAKQELELLDDLVECGFGNWLDISRRVKDKSPEECKEHYLRHYIDERSLPGLPKFQSWSYHPEPVPYAFKLQDLEEPPRFASNSTSSRLLGGYNPARSDFEANFDNHAELLVSELKYDEFSDPEDPSFELGKSLQVAVVEAYNNRLKERSRRRRIIQSHGLIALRKSAMSLQRYDSTITRALAERMLLFTQLVNGIDFDYIMEGLHRAGELKNYIRRLCEFRENGIKFFFSVPLYQKLAKLRQENERERKQCGAEYSWRAILPGLPVSGGGGSIPTPPGVSQRKIPAPLEIQGYPGYEKLSQPEKELCSNARIFPANYLDFKHLLIAENKKSGSLRLAQARLLLKIDVNKTRKLYDFLVEQGYINKRLQN